MMTIQEAVEIAESMRNRSEGIKEICDTAIRIHKASKLSKDMCECCKCPDGPLENDEEKEDVIDYKRMYEFELKRESEALALAIEREGKVIRYSKALDAISEWYGGLTEKQIDNDFPRQALEQALNDKPISSTDNSQEKK